jgi:hypothetical protein
MTLRRGFRYQVAEPSISRFWTVLDLHVDGELGHPIVATETTRVAARAKCKELNAQWLKERDDEAKEKHPIV